MTIKEKRKALDMSQKELADKLGVSESYVGYLEQGRRRASIELARKMADLFGCNWWEVYENAE